jgi:hypothetical protein
MVSGGKVWTYMEFKVVIHARRTPNGSTIGQSKNAMQQTPRDAPRLGLVPHLTTIKMIRQNENPLQQCHNATVRRLMICTFA